MSDEKNALKLLGDQIDFNLNLIILLLLFDAQKNIYTKNKIKIRHIYIYEGYENKHKCESTIYFPLIMAYTNFERTVKRIILTKIFYSWMILICS